MCCCGDARRVLDPESLGVDLAHALVAGSRDRLVPGRFMHGGDARGDISRNWGKRGLGSFERRGRCSLSGKPPFLPKRIGKRLAIKERHERVLAMR